MQRETDSTVEERADVGRVTLVGAPYSPIWHTAWPNAAIAVCILTALCDIFIGTSIVGIGVMVFVGFALIAFIFRMREYRRLSPADNVDGNPNVICRGNKNDLEELRHLPHGLVEPYAVRTAGVYTTLGRGVGVFLVIVAIVVTLRHFGEDPGLGFAYLLLLAGAGGDYVAGRYLYPVLLRVVPGRLEVVRNGPFGRGARSRNVVDLHNAGIVVDFAKRILTVHPPWDGNGPIVVRLSGIPDLHEFARNLCSAAVATLSRGDPGGS